jgi:hypothetical protein
MARKKPKKTADLKRMKAIMREQRLEREKTVGRPRSKTMESKPDAKKQRKQWRNGRDSGND